MSEFSEHYSRRDVGELPKEKDPKRDLVNFVMRDPLLGDHEKPGTIDSYLSKTPDELRELAVKVDEAADQIRDKDFSHKSSGKNYDRYRELAALLLDFADSLGKGPEEEIQPGVAVEKAREMYQDALKKAENFGDITKSDKDVVLLDPSDPEVIRMRIDEHERNGSDPEYLVAFLEAYPNLKEVQKLGSLARNSLASAERAKARIRDIETDRPFGEERDERRKQTVGELKQLERESRENYKIFKTAVKALKNGVVEL